MRKFLPLFLLPALAFTASAAADDDEKVDGVNTVVLSEDFSLLTAGSETFPSANNLEDDNLQIPANKTKMAGWMGYYLHEAGGSLLIGLDDSEIESGALTTPKIDLTAAGGAFTLSFRARSKASSDKVYIYSKEDLNTNVGTEVKLTNKWQNYSVKFENGVATSYIMFTPWLEAMYIDDIKVEVFVPVVDAPKNLSFSKYTVDGFRAQWDAVEGATSYKISVFTKDAAGNRSYAIKKQSVEGTSFDVADLPACDSFYYFTVTATDGTHNSPESAELAVEGLLLPVLNDESEVSANGFTASWAPVDHATSYNFIATKEHTAQTNGKYSFINEGFDAYTEKTTPKYDYLAIPELPGWTIASPTYVPGGVGVKSSNGQYGSDAWIQSSIYDFSHDNGNVNIKMNFYCDHKKYTSDILVGLFTYSEADKRYKVTDYKTYKAVGQTPQSIDITLTGGGQQSLIMIEPDGYANLIIDNLEISQNLKAGDRTDFTIAQASTAETSITVSNVTMDAGDKVRYVVRAVGRNAADTRNIYSDYTAPRYVALNAGIDAPEIDDAAMTGDEEVTYYDLQGRRVINPERGIYIERSSRGSRKVVF